MKILPLLWFFTFSKYEINNNWLTLLAAERLYLLLLRKKSGIDIILFKFLLPVVSQTDQYFPLMHCLRVEFPPRKCEFSLSFAVKRFN
jgi:hypothetical protein